MEEDPILEELKESIELKHDELMAASKPEDRRKFGQELLELEQRRNDREQEVYFTLEIPEDLELDGLSLDELYVYYKLIHKFFVAVDTPLPDKHDEELRSARYHALQLQLDEIRLALDNSRRESYDPGPDDPPIFEPSGYSATPGFVKSQPGNNEHYVEGFRDDPWYEIIRWTHDELESLIPGYNIAQIKEKFGGLRYYFDYPEVIPTKPEWPAYSTVEKIKAMVKDRISYAEGWVAGYERAKQQLKEQTKNEGIQ